MTEPPSVAPWTAFMEAVGIRRAARRRLRSQAQEIHDEERSQNALHATDARWEDCYDCACLSLRRARAALGMSRYPPAA